MVEDADIPTTIVNVSSRPIAKKAMVHFLRGPIPLPWLQRAASLPGKAYTLGSILWWFKGMNPTRPIKVTAKSLRNFSLSESAYLDGLKRLEEVGLVSVTRKKGQRALIEIIVLQGEAVRPLKAPGP
jgi:hypothetical protein